MQLVGACVRVFGTAHAVWFLWPRSGAVEQTGRPVGDLCRSLRVASGTCQGSRQSGPMSHTGMAALLGMWLGCGCVWLVNEVPNHQCYMNA